MKLTIKITKDIYQRSMMCGVSEDISVLESISESCAIALAVRDIFPYAAVGKTSIFFNTMQYNVSLPKEAIELIEKFDGLVTNYIERLNLPEIEFDINVPEAVIDSINIDKVKEILIDHPNLVLHETA